LTPTIPTLFPYTTLFRSLLTPTIDHLFDKGFISFENRGNLIISPVADPTSLERMGIPIQGALNVGAFSEGQRWFLEYHRDNVLRDRKSTRLNSSHVKISY